MISLIFISEEPPTISVAWMNPLTPSVTSGVIVACGRVWMILLARWMALTILPLAKPGWIDTPVTVTSAPSAEKVSYSISPTRPPSKV